MSRGSKLLILLGLLLILGSIGAFVTARILANRAGTEARDTVSRLRELLPEKRPGMQDRYTDMQMPVLQLDGRDLVAIVEIPGFGTELPVRNSWNPGTLHNSPCRYWGTCYDGSLIIGGSSQPGQFDCFGQLQPGATVRLTDMTGAVFTYTVTRIDRAASAAPEKLTGGEAQLTLFTRDPYTLDYILVRCSLG